MTARLLRALTAGVIFVFAAGVQAEEPNSKLWYVALGAAPAWYNSPGLSQGGVDASLRLESPGFGISGAFGRYVDDIKVIRLEGEVLYTRADVSSVGGVAAGGDLSSVGLMVNAFYDFNTNSNWTPFIGGGIGYSNVALNNLSLGGVTLVDDSNGAFSWQFKTGVSYQLTPSFSINGAYRVYGTDNLSFKDTGGATVNMDGPLIQMAEFGVRFHF